MEMNNKYIEMKGFLSFLIMHEINKMALCGEDLAEKIGNKMQEAVLEVSRTVSAGLGEGLQKVLGPAIQKLVTSSPFCFSLVLNTPFAFSFLFD